MLPYPIFLVCFSLLPHVFAQTQLRILHTNDLHARFDQTSQLSGKCTEANAKAHRCYGGFPRLVSAVNSQRRLALSKGISLLFLNAGDSYQGTVWYSIYKWPIVAAFTNLLGLDAMSLGNHEFDDGPANLAPFVRNITVPVVSCNLNLAREPVMANTPIVPSVVLLRGDLKIGIIGYLTPDTKTLASIGNVVIYEEIANITKEALRLKESGVSVIIALGHSGYDKDKEIARLVPDVDIVVGGHSHSFLYTGDPPDNDRPVGPYPTFVKQASGRLVPVVQAYAFSKYLGILDVWLDSKGEVINATGQPLLLDSSIEQDSVVLTEITKWQQGIANLSKEEIGTTRVLLNSSCRFSECNLGNVIADAMVDYVSFSVRGFHVVPRTVGPAESLKSVRNVERMNWTKAAISIVQGGSVRASIYHTNGIITREDVITSMPFYNPILIISLKGQYLLEALEWSVTRYDPQLVIGRGEFLQVSGIHVTYDISRPVGSRVVRATARCSNCLVPSYSPIEPLAEYNLIVGSYIFKGGDNYTMIAKHGKVLQQFVDLDTDIVTEYIKRRQLLFDGLEERITFVKHEHFSKRVRSNAVNLIPPSLYLVTLIQFSRLLQ